ncbi:membrane protein insertion efficiency factor YidD [Neptuniibacter sp. SY11_33]|uniref:membrane protein insertion efficiency factor YidD n=1 Tax=unclassified Neptuniibacter TaxID=2630693 RepID=UPI0039F70AB2
MLSFLQRCLSSLLIGLVNIYRYLISPVIGPRCRFHPTCSSYMIEAIKLHGPFKGVWLGLKRLSKCHPYNDGGYDPVPMPKNCCDHHAEQDSSSSK